MSAQENTGPTSAEKLARGGQVTVERYDGNLATVFVRILPIREYQAYAEAMRDEEKVVDLLIGKPDSTETLTPEAIGQIVEEGLRLNAAFFPWWDRQKRLIERVGIRVQGS